MQQEQHKKTETTQQEGLSNEGITTENITLASLSSPPLISSPSNIVNLDKDNKIRKENFSKILEKEQELLYQKEKIYKTRYSYLFNNNENNNNTNPVTDDNTSSSSGNTTITTATTTTTSNNNNSSSKKTISTSDKIAIKNHLQEEINKLKELEKELKILRAHDYKIFNKSLRLEELELEINVPQISTTTSPISVRTRKTSLKLRDDRKQKAMQSWDSVLNVAKAASKWKRKWETTKNIEAQNILDETIANQENLDSLSDEESSQQFPGSPASLTKDQILELRTTMYRLRQRKQLSPKEALLLQSVALRLKSLDHKYTTKVNLRSTNQDESVLFENTEEQVQQQQHQHQQQQQH